MSAIKKPRTAFILSFFVPGAGLFYLDRPVWGFVNFAVVNAVIAVLLILPPGSDVFEYFHYVVLMLLAASGGIAHAAATSRSKGEAVPRQRIGGRQDVVKSG